jgi:hypothetical protein
VAVLDFDDRAAYDEMVATLGPLQAWSTSPSNGVHCYLVNRPDLPARILWGGRNVGELQRGDRQQVVMPPSPYPGKPSRGIPPGGEYRWLVDPRGAVPELPVAWFGYLTSPPEHIQALTGDTPGHENDGDNWNGPGAEAILERALQQPGRKVRKNGVHFQCAGCLKQGRDRSMDNAIVFFNGKFTCTVAREAHRSAIALQLRIGLDYEEPEAPLAEDVPGYQDPMAAPLAEDVPGYQDPRDYPLAEDVPGYKDPMSYPLEEDFK